MIKKKTKLTIFRTLIDIIANFINKFNLKILKIQKKSVFNLILISSICIVFLYLTYLSIPSFYKNDLHKSFVQDLQKSLNHELSIPKNIKYSIIPRPHFVYNDVKFLDKGDTNISNFAEIKKLKIFISQKNLFNKLKIKPKYIVIDEGNFYFNSNNVKNLNFIFTSKLYTDVLIKNSNLFFKNKSKELITLLSSNYIELEFDKKNKKNSAKLLGKIFNTSIKIESSIDFSSKKNQTSIYLKDLKLKIKNGSSYDKNYSSYNQIKSFRTNLNSNIKLEKKRLYIKSIESNFQLIPLNYAVDVDLNPFSFNSEISLEKININKLGSPVLLEDLIKNFILENKVINGNIIFKIDNIKNNKLIDDLYMVLNLNSGIISFKKTEFKIKKIGNLNILSNSFRLDDDRLTFRGNFNLVVKNEKEFYKKFMIPKKNRFPIRNVEVNCVYSFATNKFYVDKIIFNNDRINIIDIQYEEIDNWPKFKKLIQNSTNFYSG